MLDPVIYVIVNRRNGKVYVGQTRQGLARRKGEHVYRLNLGERDHKLYRAMRKHGLENFCFEVLYRCDDVAELDGMEKFFIGAANSFHRGYNMTCGGDSVSEETRAKLSAAFRGRKITWYDKIVAIRKANRLSGVEKKHPGLRGADHVLSKSYRIRFPDGHCETIVGLNKFCQEHGLTKKCLMDVLSGVQSHHKGYALLARFNDQSGSSYSQAAGNGA